MVKRCAAKTSPRPQKIQPMKLAGRREAISAPTVGNASESTPASTTKLKSTLASRIGIVPVRKSSKRASATRTTHTAHSDQANQAAVRRLIPPILRLCFLVPFVTTTTLQDYLLPSITTTVTGPFNEAGVSSRRPLLPQS